MFLNEFADKLIFNNPFEVFKNQKDQNLPMQVFTKATCLYRISHQDVSSLKSVVSNSSAVLSSVNLG